MTFVKEMPACIILPNLYAQWVFNFRLPVSNDTLIDKSAYRSNDPQTLERLTAYFLDRVVLHTSAAAVIEGLNIVAHIPYNPYAFCLLTHAAWNAWAHHKLKTGKWTAVTKPPVQKKEEKKIASGASVGVLPVRANFAPSVTNTPLTPQ